MKGETAVQAVDKSLRNAVIALRYYLSTEAERGTAESEALETINSEWAEEREALRTRTILFLSLVDDILDRPDSAAKRLGAHTEYATKKLEKARLYLKLKHEIENDFLSFSEPSPDLQ